MAEEMEDYIMRRADGGDKVYLVKALRNKCQQLEKVVAAYKHRKALRNKCQHLEKVVAAYKHHAKVMESRPTSDWDPPQAYQAWDKELTQAENALKDLGEDI